MSGELWLRELFLRDLAAFAIQLAVIIAAGAALWRLCRIRQPAISLAFWRVLLLSCLLLPGLQPWRPGPQSSPAPTSTELSEPGGSILTAGAIVADVPRALPIDASVFFVLAAGIVLRGLWLVLGAWNLRRLRRAAVRLEPVPAVVRQAEARIGARADVYVSDRITGPITFGLFRPIVMVPPGVIAMDGALQEAIASHELLHVQRRDWISVIAEEVIRTVFWFHPGIWWLIGRIQLSREHVVDEAVIRLTQSRDRYVEALLAVARTGAPIALAPAPLFIRRRFLKKRVAQILQETTMTTRRLIASVSISTGALAVAAVLVVRAFPLEAQAPQTGFATYTLRTSSTDSVQITRGGEHLLHGALPEYPKRAIENKVEGEVVLDVTVNDRGEVSDARVASGPEELRRAALESVLQWHYSPEALKSTSTTVALQFRVPTGTTNYVMRRKVDERQLEPGQRTEQQVKELEKVLGETSDPERMAEIKRKLEERQVELKMAVAKLMEGEAQPELESTSRLVRIRTERVPQEVVQEIRERAGISIGDPITRDMVRRIHEIVTAVDEHLTVRFEKDKNGGLVMVLLAP